MGWTGLVVTARREVRREIARRVLARQLPPQDVSARGWQRHVGDVHARRRFASLFGKPPGELGPTAIAGGRWILIPTGCLADRAMQSHMEVIIMPPPGSQLLEPGRPRDLLADGFLDEGMD